MKPLVDLFCTAALLAGIFTTAHAAPCETVPGRFIVVLKRGATAERIASVHGVATDALYTSAINGFAGAVPEGRLAALKKHADVLAVEPDIIVGIDALEMIVTGKGRGVNSTGESVPTGINRANANSNPQTDLSSVGIAILDTGISRKHPDLNVAGAVSYVRGNKNGEDDNGHGSHVAGIVAAKLNGGGIRGVAPNARLFSVKVLDRRGNGQLSRLIAGIDWVTRNAASQGIKVANMSFGFQGNSSSLNSAISNMVAAGVTTVVAAGNIGIDASTFSPANHPSVICVSAIADSDGRPGGFGADTSYGFDDALATFSNYGPVVAIAAPGVNIYSTYKRGRYAIMSGTSMASPHVAGAAALYIADHPSATPADVKQALIGSAWPQGDGASFAGDRDSSPEPLLNAAGL